MNDGEKHCHDSLVHTKAEFLSLATDVWTRVGLCTVAMWRLQPFGTSQLVCISIIRVPIEK